MADFTTVFSTGVTSAQWLDPAGPAGVPPSRLNARTGFPHTRWMGKVGTQITVSAVVAGVTGPLDSALGGRLFQSWFVQAPASPLACSSPGGQSSVQAFTPPAPGHYVVALYRQAGGTEHIHVDVQ